MPEETTNAQAIGHVNISEEVIAIVSGVAAAEIKGVAGMCNTITGGLAEMLGKKSFSKGVKVELAVPDVKITLSIVVQYGSKIPDVAWEVQEQVKRAVENMTGLNVTAVDVYVSGLEMPKEEPAVQPEPAEG